MKTFLGEPLRAKSAIQKLIGVNGLRKKSGKFFEGQESIAKMTGF